MGKSDSTIEELLVAAQHEIFQTWWLLLLTDAPVYFSGQLERAREWSILPILEALPSQAHWSVDADEEEEWSSEEFFKSLLVDDVGKDPPLVPRLRNG